MSTHNYTIVLEPAEEGGYTVTVPALPAIVTEGDTFDEAIAMARDAIALYVQTLIDDGKPVPEEKPPSSPVSVQVQIDVPATL